MDRQADSVRSSRALRAAPSICKPKSRHRVAIHADVIEATHVLWPLVVVAVVVALYVAFRSDIYVRILTFFGSQLVCKLSGL